MLPEVRIGGRVSDESARHGRAEPPLPVAMPRLQEAVHGPHRHDLRGVACASSQLVPLHKWCRAYWEACACKNGVSALELSRKIQVSNKTALFMMHRIRWAMAEDHTTPPKMTGTVEADETYVGGKPRYRGTSKRGRGTSKQPVAAVVQRGGSVRTRIIPTVNSANVKGIVRDNVDRSARVVTDQERGYRGLGPEFAAHDSVNHGAREYVRGDVHTNTIEGFFSRVKRGLNGTYHAVSREHLHRYLSQFEFAYNTRDLNDGDRVIELLTRSVGKRLAYRTTGHD
ncbi:MAG: IS1595 family transposase [Planctomycetota bacterium]